MATGDRKKCNEIAISGSAKNKCPICKEKFRRPKLLSCFHTFCERCLQGKAGTSTSFHCPLCETFVSLPVGGVNALKTTSNIEDDQLLPRQPLCERCDDNKATLSCLQCQRRLCLVCCQNHECRTSTQGQSSVPSTSGEVESGCHKRDLRIVAMCAMHPEQHLLDCSTCQTEICPQCKPTLHQNHLTKDREDTWSNVKDKVDFLRSEIVNMESMATAFEERCSKLHDQKIAEQQSCQARGDKLKQWVRQCVDEATQSLQDSTEPLFKHWQGHAQQLRNKTCALQAQLDHILRVLNCGKETGVVFLNAQLCAAHGKNEEMNKMMYELTINVPSVHADNNSIAVNRAQLCAFVGLQDPQKPILIPDRIYSPTPSETTHVDASNATDEISSGTRSWKVLEFVYSSNPCSSVIDICPISHGRLWVLSKGVENIPPELKLLSAEGRVLVTVVYRKPDRRLLSVNEDVLLSWAYQDRNVDLIFPDGSMTTYDMGKKFHSFVSNDLSNTHYMLTIESTHLLRVKFARVTEDRTDSADSADSDLARSDLQSRRTPGPSPVRKQVTHTILGTVVASIPPNLSHVSATGNYLACISENRRYIKITAVGITAKEGGLSTVGHFYSKHGFLAARFYMINGRTVLLTFIQGKRTVGILGLKDKGDGAGYWKSGSVKLKSHRCLAVDLDGHVWVGCRGGKVVRIEGDL